MLKKKTSIDEPDQVEFWKEHLWMGQIWKKRTSNWPKEEVERRKETGGEKQPCGAQKMPRPSQKSLKKKRGRSLVWKINYSGGGN